MRIVLLTVVVAAAAMAADNTIDGTWDVQTEVMGNAGSAVCTLKQDGNKITGKCTGAGKPQEATGEVTGDKLTFKHGAEYNGEPLTIVYSGKFESAAVLVGEINVQPYDVAGSFKATKKAE